MNPLRRHTNYVLAHNDGTQHQVKRSLLAMNLRVWKQVEYYEQTRPLHIQGLPQKDKEGWM
eukprot:5088982-Amphidinium_carterae.1